MILSERNLEIRNDVTKEKIITINVTLMYEALRYMKMKKLDNYIIDKTNHVRLRKNLNLPLELVGANGRSITDAFDKKNSNSKVKWKSKFRA